MSQPQRREREAPYSYREAPQRNSRAYAGSRMGDRRSREAGRSQPPVTTQLARRWGQLPGRFGVLVIIGSAAIGALLTAVTGRAPGIVLGVCLVAGTVAGALAIRPRTGYLILPVPAIAYLGAALIAGLIYNRSNDGSSTFLAVNGTQWIASGFIAMAVATGVAIVITAIRWRRFSPLRDEDYRTSDRPSRGRSSSRRADRAYLSPTDSQTTFSADRQT